MRKIIKIILLVTGTFIHFFAFGVTNIKVNPIRLVLSPKNPIATLRLTNLTGKPASFQTSEKFCKLVHSEAVCKVNTEFIVSPPVFTLIPHKEQIIRIGLPNAQPVSTEKLYRLYLREIPSKHPDLTKGMSKIKTLLHISIPVYLTPQKVEHHSYFKAKISGDHKLILYFENNGNIHEYTQAVSISSKQHATPQSKKFMHYIFPHQTRELMEPLPKGYWNDTELHVELATQYKTFKTDVAQG